MTTKRWLPEKQWSVIKNLISYKHGKFRTRSESARPGFQNGTSCLHVLRAELLRHWWSFKCLRSLERSNGKEQMYEGKKKGMYRRQPFPIEEDNCSEHKKGD